MNKPCGFCELGCLRQYLLSACGTCEHRSCTERSGKRPLTLAVGVTLTDWNHPTWHSLTETTQPDTDWLKLPDLTLTDWNHPTWLTETTRSDTDWNHPTWHWLKPPDKAQLVHSLSYSYLLLLPVFLSFFFSSLLCSSLLCSFPPFFFFWKMVALHWHMTFGRYHGFGDQLYFSLLSLCLFIAVHDGEILHLKCCLNRNCLLQYSLSL